MICSQCGNEITEEQAFGNVGGAAPKHRPKGILTILLAVALVISLGAVVFLLFDKDDPQADEGNEKTQRLEGNGFSSPEDAITAYVEALQDGDIGKMVSTFAIESYAEGFDFEAYLRVYPSIQLHAIGVPLPNSGAYQEQLNAYARYATIASDIRLGYLALIDIDYLPIYHVRPGDEMDAEIEALTEELSGNNFDKELSQMEIGDILTEEELDANKKVVAHQFDNYFAYLDVDDLQEVAIEVEFDGKDFILYMLTAEIDGRWYNLTTNSPTYYMDTAAADQPLLGGVLKQ